MYRCYQTMLRKRGEIEQVSVLFLVSKFNFPDNSSEILINRDSFYFLECTTLNKSSFN